MTNHTLNPETETETSTRRRRGPGWRTGVRRRRGSGLIEVLLAITIFALIATSHAAVTLRYATRIKDVKTGATRSAVLQEKIVRLAAVPFDSLPGRAGCITITTTDLPNTSCITITDVSTVKRTVMLVFRPTSSTMMPDTIFMTRTKSSSNPLT